MLLKNLKYKPYGSSELKPSGWLKTQLRIQADGLSGNLQKIWPDIRDSAWIGGKCDGWERVPYWLDGFIPLAYLLEDAALIADADRYINAILERIKPDGWVCPCEDDKRGEYDMWAYLLICKVLTVYADCNKSAEARIQTALEKALARLDEHLDVYPLKSWGWARWFEGLIPIYWLYERNHNDRLIELAVKLKTQGADWEKILGSEYITQARRKWTMETHIVNLNMAIKSGALMSRIDGDDPDRFAKLEVDTLDKYHSMASGAFAGDECLAGDYPTQGTELCGIVEGMYSYENLLAISGNPYWADRLEMLAFNALPATISADMWTHQYDQLTNQIECAPLPPENVVFMTNGNMSNTFGIEPGYGCCTSNFSQGWPKLAMSSFMKNEKGIVSVVLVPSVLNTKIGNANVTVELETDYPFGNKLTYKIKTDAPISFGLKIRVPDFADSVTVDGVDRFTDLKWISMGRIWDGESEVKLELEMKPRVVKRPHGMVCVKRGPLLFSVAIKEEWERIESERNGERIVYPYCDFYVHPKSPWNYALTSESFRLKHNQFTSAFSTDNPPVELTAEAVKIPWSIVNGVAANQPDSLEPQGEPEKIRLIPYGCARLRMTEIPLIK